MDTSWQECLHTFYVIAAEFIVVSPVQDCNSLKFFSIILKSFPFARPQFRLQLNNWVAQLHSSQIWLQWMIWSAWYFIKKNSKRKWKWFQKVSIKRASITALGVAVSVMLQINLFPPKRFIKTFGDYNVWCYFYNFRPFFNKIFIIFRICFLCKTRKW